MRTVALYQRRGPMKKVIAGTLLAFAALWGFISCATGVTTEEFQAYQVEQEREIARLEGEISEIQNLEKSMGQLSQKIESLEERFKAAEDGIEKLKNDAAADNRVVDELKKEVEHLSTEFSTLYGALTELVQYAGYDSTDQFLQLAHDIVDVNKNINQLNERLERLRTAMAAFVED
jgi:chromosome segregation ATPase